MNLQTCLLGVVALGLTVGGRLVYDKYRVGNVDNVEQIAQQLKQVPQQLETWDAVGEPVTLQQSVLDVLQCYEHAGTSYTNRETGKTLQALVLVGPWGQTSVHTPGVCAPGSGLKLIDDQPVRLTVEANGTTHQVYRQRFGSPDYDSEIYEIYYAWTTTGTWEAPEVPRVAYSGVPYLYKLQVTYRPDPNEEVGETATAFLQEFFAHGGEYLVSVK